MQLQLRSASWTGANSKEASDARLLDYQEVHSTAFDGLVTNNWHHYIDHQQTYRHTQHTVTVLNDFVVSVHCTLEACVCVCVPVLTGAEGEG